MTSIPIKKETVKLISAEGFEFLIDYRAACVSATIKNMLGSQGGFTETERGEIRFPEISTAALEKACQYFYYKLKWANAPSKDIPVFKVETEMALELLMASNYLDT